MGLKGSLGGWLVLFLLAGCGGPREGLPGTVGTTPISTLAPGPSGAATLPPTASPSPFATPAAQLTFNPDPATPAAGVIVLFRGSSVKPPRLRLVGVGGSGEPVDIWREGGEVELRPSGPGEWRVGALAPGQPGVYPAVIVVEDASGTRELSDSSWLLRVYPEGFRERPGASDPEGAVRGWLAVHEPGSVLSSVQERPLLPDDRRVPELHKLYMVSYGRAGGGALTTLFVYVSRDGVGGPWRVLSWGTGP